jgi:hypothetical protein
MDRLTLALALVAFSSLAHAGIDYKCMEACSDEGSPFQYCSTKCTTSDFATTQLPMADADKPVAQTQEPAATSAPRTEPNCLDECTRDGYEKLYCQQRCTF